MPRGLSGAEYAGNSDDVGVHTDRLVVRLHPLYELLFGRTYEILDVELQTYYAQTV